MSAVHAPSRGRQDDFRTLRASLHGRNPRYRITNGFAIGSFDRFTQIVFGRV